MNKNNLNSNIMPPIHTNKNPYPYNSSNKNNINLSNIISNNSTNSTNSNNLTKPYYEYFVKMVQNTREHMEDFHLISEKFNGKENHALFALFDGHGGIDVAKKLKDELSLRFAKLINSDKYEATENHIKTLFRKFDEDVVKQYTNSSLQKFESTNFESLGSTCTLLYIIKEHNKPTILYSANIGDTKGILISKDSVAKITYDHKPSDEAEAKRVKNSGGAIFSGRIFGQMSLTRAFGNIPLKKWIISDPYIKKTVLSETDKFIIIASDGIWDVINEDECLEMSTQSSHTAKSFCEELVTNALSRWSKDNISCIVVKI